MGVNEEIWHFLLKIAGDIFLGVIVSIISGILLYYANKKYRDKVIRHLNLLRNRNYYFRFKWVIRFKAPPRIEFKNSHITEIIHSIGNRYSLKQIYNDGLNFDLSIDELAIINTMVEPASDIRSEIDIFLLKDEFNEFNTIISSRTYLSDNINSQDLFKKIIHVGEEIIKILKKYQFPEIQVLSNVLLLDIMAKPKEHKVIEYPKRCIKVYLLPKENRMRIESTDPPRDIHDNLRDFAHMIK